MRRALDIDETIYGKEHPYVAIVLNNLAQLLKANNRLEEAEPLSRRHLEILQLFSMRTGHEHPHLKAGRKNYKDLLVAMGHSEEESKAIIESLIESVKNKVDTGRTCKLTNQPILTKVITS